MSKARQQEVSPVLLHPCRQIQQALGVSENTVYWWAKHYGLPLFHLPNGETATTVGLIEQWARERRADELSRGSTREERRQGRPLTEPRPHPTGVVTRMKMVA